MTFANLFFAFGLLGLMLMNFFLVFMMSLRTQSLSINPNKGILEGLLGICQVV